MLPPRALRRIVFTHAIITGLLTAAVGCGSVSPLKQDAGGDAAQGTAGGSGSAGAGSPGTAGGSGSAGAGGPGTGGTSGTGGAGGSAANYCDTESDCVFRAQCCAGVCAAKAASLPPPMFCSTSCVINVSPPTCGCVNHQCSSASICIVPGSGLCPYCANGYLTGPEGCQTCACAPPDGGSDGGSPGSVTLRLVIAPGQSFCDQACQGPTHITILDGTGKVLQTYNPSCSTTCSAACTPSLCPAIACFPTGRAVQTNELVWDGTSMATSTCGNHVTCFQPSFAPAGRYVARMCATPGTLTTADAGLFSTCTATAPTECVDVPFDYPGPSPVTGTLP